MKTFLSKSSSRLVDHIQDDGSGIEDYGSDASNETDDENEEDGGEDSTHDNDREITDNYGDDNVDDEHKEILDEEYNLLADDLMHLRQNNCQGCWMYDKVNSKRASNFFQVPIGKSTKNMKKQTACWLLTTEKTRLSALPAVTEFYYFVFEHQYLCSNIHRALEIFSYLSRVTWSITNESVMLCLVSEANITRYGISENSHNIHDISVNAVSISCNTVIFNKELRFFR